MSMYDQVKLHYDLFYFAMFSGSPTKKAATKGGDLKRKKGRVTGKRRSCSRYYI